MTVITNQIESTGDCKSIGSVTGIGIAIAWVMKSGNKRDMTCDDNAHFCVTRAKKQANTFTHWRIIISILQLLMMATSTNSKTLRQEWWLKTSQNPMSIIYQNESTNDWKCIGSGWQWHCHSWMMKCGNKKDMTCDEDDYFVHEKHWEQTENG